MSPRNSSEGTTFFCELVHPTDARRANENKALRISYRDAGFLDFVGRGREQRLLCRTLDLATKTRGIPSSLVLKRTDYAARFLAPPRPPRCLEPEAAWDFSRCSSFIISLGLIFFSKPSIFRRAACSSFRFCPSNCATLVCFISRSMLISDSYSQIS